MEPDALRALEDEADSVLAGRIAASSRTSYRNSTARFLSWMFLHKRQLIQDAFATQLSAGDDGVPTRESLLRALATAPANPPLHFQRLTARDFIAWIVSMKTDKDKYFTFSTYATHRSALGCLFRDYGETMRAQVSQDLSNCFSGLKKRVARQAGAGQSQVKVGKNPLPFNFFKRLALSMLVDTSRDLIFARTFMLLSWNLMSRAANTTSICYKHLEWGEDALRVYFAHMKNDQGGSRPRDPRHVYANPLQPEICPILSLGIYWATYGIDTTSDYIFPGSNQYDRFRKILGRVLGQTAMEEELTHRGMDADSIGTHSMRKGAATFCSSGSTACPSAIAVHLRAGWAMGGVTDRYLRHDGAGDMHVGRTVCGLPSDKAEFATLPPQFKAGQDIVTTAKRVCFHGLPVIAAGVGEFALASLIYHLDFLKQYLPSQHPLFQNPVLRNGDITSQLQACLFPDGEGTIVPTGIPPHVSLLGEMKAVKQALINQQAAMQEATDRQQQLQVSLVQNVVAGVTKVLEDRATETGVPTCDRLAATVMSRLEDAGLVRLLERLENGTASAETTAPLTQEEEAAPCPHPNPYPLICWGGRLHEFPMGMQLPRCPPDQAWIFWCCGDPSQDAPPLRRLKPFDLVPVDPPEEPGNCDPQPNGQHKRVSDQRKRLSDLKYLMHQIEIVQQSWGWPLLT